MTSLHDGSTLGSSSVKDVPTESKPDPNLVSWDGPDDPENPQNWTLSRKWFLTSLAGLTTINVTYASAAIATASGTISRYFHKSSEVGYLITAIFLFGYVLGPFIWGPGSELFGRRPIFTVSFICYVLLYLGQALAQNVETLLVTRFLGGAFACAPLTSGGGLLSDMWDPKGRVAAAALFLTCVFLGPCIGPIVGGFIEESGVSWTWNFWVAMIFSGVCTIIIIFLWPETYAPVILQKKAKRLRKADPVGNKDLYAAHEKTDWSWRGLLERTLFRPFHMMAVELILVLVTLYVSLVYGILYGLLEALPIVFIVKRGFSPYQLGLVFIGVGIGVILAGLTFLYHGRNYAALQLKWRGHPPPEERLHGAMLAGPLLVTGIFWLGWTGEYSNVPWYVPALSTIPIGASVCLVFLSFMSFVTDTYMMYTASAFSVITIIRSCVGGAFPLFTTQMFNGMGIHWACTLLGLISLILVPMPLLFYKYGPILRARSKYAPGLDLALAQELKAAAAAQDEKRVREDSV